MPFQEGASTPSFAGGGGELRFRAPAVFSGEQDVLPSERRDVGKKRGIGRLTGSGEFADDASELAGVPVDDSAMRWC